MRYLNLKLLLQSCLHSCGVNTHNTEVDERQQSVVTVVPWTQYIITYGVHCRHVFTVVIAIPLHSALFLTYYVASLNEKFNFTFGKL